MHYKQMQLVNVWKTCNKIRSAIFRIRFDLWDYYKPLNPRRNSLISESAFVSVLSGDLRSIIGLSNYEICKLTGYFRVLDGIIHFSQFYKVIQNRIPEFARYTHLVTSLELEDPLQVNRLSLTEERRLQLLITKISCIIKARKIILRPFFQDYELLSTGNGTVTIAHFARVLSFVRITIEADDFNLLVKKYLKHWFTVNFIAFENDIKMTEEYLNQHGVLYMDGDIMSKFPGRLVTAEVPKLPHPETGKIDAGSIFGKQSIFHPALNPLKHAEPIIDLIRRIQRYVFVNRISVCEFFKEFDALGSGRVTASEFHRGLDNLRMSGLHRLYLSLPEIKIILMQYADPVDPRRVCWRTFQDDIDQVFTTKELEKAPMLHVVTPPIEVKEITSKGAKNRNVVPQTVRDLCEKTIKKVKNCIMRRRILLKPVFRYHDKHKNGHVSCFQMRHALLLNGIILSDEAFYSLEERFNDDLGFNYYRFMQEVEPKPHDEALDYDETNYGTLLQKRFLKPLSLRRMYHRISRAEFDLVAKCYSFERNLRSRRN